MEKKLKFRLAISLALVMVIMATLVVSFVGAYVYNASRLPVDVYDDKGNSMDKLVNDMPSGMQFMAENKSVAIKAILTPANSNSRVSWTAAWKNAAATWAVGKNVADYMVVTPSSSGSLIATVNCSQPFGEKIIITVTSVIDSNIKASCTVDYFTYITDVVVKDVGLDKTWANTPDGVNQPQYKWYNNNGDVSVSIVESVGTTSTHFDLFTGAQLRFVAKLRNDAFIPSDIDFSETLSDERFCLTKTYDRSASLIFYEYGLPQLFNYGMYNFYPLVVAGDNKVLDRFTALLAGEGAFAINKFNGKSLLDVMKSAKPGCLEFHVYQLLDDVRITSFTRYASFDMSTVEFPIVPTGITIEGGSSMVIK